ncbi:hypothetical protein HYW74_04155 [Candidatus Pacearchaeota archaeon]|nr:hypothetical protein [Candidatus Pacearchaeota archaeon]
MKAKNILIKTSAVLMSLIIIAVLVISGPAQAFTLAIDSNKDFVSKGENITFDVSVKMNSNEETSLNTITLTLDGPDGSKECVFDSNGNKLSQCMGVVNITKVNVAGGIYGYLSEFGYGFKDKEVTYKITLDTDGYSLGAYDIIAKAVIGNDVIIQEMSNKVVIKSESSSSNPYGHSRGNSKKTNVNNAGDSKQTLKVTSGDDYTIMTSEDWHEMQIESIDADSVHVGINSNDKQELEIKMDETEKVDLNKDQKEDMEMSIWFLGKNEASIYAEVYDGKIIKDDKAQTSNIASQKLTAKKANSLTKIPVVVKDENEAGNTNSTNNYWFMILIFVLVNLIMVALVGIVYAKKR